MLISLPHTPKLTQHLSHLLSHVSLSEMGE